MKDIDLFQMALGLTPPWQVSASEFNLDKKRLDIRLDFPRGSTFSCPKCAQTDLKAFESLNILMIYRYFPPKYKAFLKFSEWVNLEIMRRFQAEGIEFAFPTNTTYLAQDDLLSWSFSFIFLCLSDLNS